MCILSITSVLSFYHIKVIIIGILITFIPIHFLSFNTLPRRISDFPDSINWWNSLSSLGCSLTWVSFFVLMYWIQYIKTKNDTQVRLQPRELSEFHQFIESGKSDILLGRVLKDKKCIGINVINIPIIITLIW